MAKHWAKVHRGAMLSERLCALWRKSKIACALYWPLKAEADDFGRFTANPAKFAHVVGGLTGLSPAQAAKAMDAMEECGLIRRYTVDGDELLELIDYHKHDSPNWLRLSGPEYPAPPGWEPPPSLVEFAEKSGDLENVTPDRYGIHLGLSAACDRVVRLMERTREKPVPPPAPTGESTPVPTPVPTPDPTPVPQVPDTDGTEQNRTESDQNNNGLAPARAREAPPADPSDDHLILSEFRELADVINRLRGDVWSVRQRQWWTVDLARAIRDEHTPLTEEEIIAALEETVPDVADKPNLWLSRLLGRKRQEQKADPDAERLDALRAIDDEYTAYLAERAALAQAEQEVQA